MKRLLLFSLLLLCLPFFGFAGTVYTYTGQELTCASTPPCSGSVSAISITLNFDSPLISDTEYYNSGYPGLLVPGSVPFTGLNSWSISDGTNTIQSTSTTYTLFALDLKTDASGAIISWFAGAQDVLAGSETQLTLGTNSLLPTDESIYQARLATGGTDTTWWRSEDAGAWTRDDGPVAAPEPGTLALSGLALCAVAFLRRHASC